MSHCLAPCLPPQPCPLLDCPQRIVPHDPQVHEGKAAGFPMFPVLWSGVGARLSSGHRYTTPHHPPSFLRRHSFRVCAAHLTTLSPSPLLSSSAPPPPRWSSLIHVYCGTQLLAFISTPRPVIILDEFHGHPTPGSQAPSLLPFDELLNVPWLLIPKGDLGLVIAPNLLNTCSAFLLSDHVPVLLGDICAIVTHTFSF